MVAKLRQRALEFDGHADDSPETGINDVPIAEQDRRIFGPRTSADSDGELPLQ